MKRKSFQELSYGISLSPFINDDVIRDINLIADTMNKHGKFKRGGTFYNTSVTPIFADKYFLQLNVLLVMILLVIIYYQKKGLKQKNKKILDALIGLASIFMAFSTKC